jgi:hypothetical protein
MAFVDFEGNSTDESIPDGEVRETKLDFERIVTDTENLKEE